MEAGQEEQKTAKDGWRKPAACEHAWRGGKLDRTAQGEGHDRIGTGKEYLSQTVPRTYWSWLQSLAPGTSCHQQQKLAEFLFGCRLCGIPKAHREEEYALATCACDVAGNCARMLTPSPHSFFMSCSSRLSASPRVSPARFALPSAAEVDVTSSETACWYQESAVHLKVYTHWHARSC